MKLVEKIDVTKPVEPKWIRADSLWSRIAGSAFFSTEEKNKIRFMIDTEPEVHGHWIDQGYKIFKCSNCGNYLDFRGVNAGRGTTNYCPNCGAKMWNILTRKPQKLTKREEEIRDYIVNEYGEEKRSDE